MGLDLAWSPANPSGAWAASWDGRVARLLEPPRSDLGGNDEIVEYVLRLAGPGRVVVAVDCPLAVPNNGGSGPRGA